LKPTLTALLIFSALPSFALENSVNLGMLQYSSTPVEFGGGEGSLTGDRFRLVMEDQYPGFLASKHIGLNISPVSIAYYRTANGPYVSINPAVLIVAVIGAFSVPPDTLYHKDLSYLGFGPFSTIALLPQLLTNWSLRLDVINQKAGFTAGPTTDFLAGRKFWVRTELQSGAYLVLGDIEVKGAVAYDVSGRKDRFYLSLLKSGGP